MKKLRVEFTMDRHGNTGYQDVTCASIIDLGGITYFLTIYNSGSMTPIRADYIAFAYRTADIRLITPYTIMNNTPDSNYID